MLTYEKGGPLVELKVGITDHLEGRPDESSVGVFDEVGELVRVADECGVDYAWFAEHHANVHLGHMPAPLLFALHQSALTKRIHLGTAIICLDLHHPRDAAEQVAVMDLLCGGRSAVGFGSACTPEEQKLFGLEPIDETARHQRFEQNLQTILKIWNEPNAYPRPSGDLPSRCWLAANSAAAARIAGTFNFNLMFSHLRTVEQYRQMADVYHRAGGARQIAANRPIFVGQDDESAFETAMPALQVLRRRFQQEGKIDAQQCEPRTIEALSAHPINFIVGGPQTVAREIRKLLDQFPFDVLNAELRWAGLSQSDVRESLRRLMKEVLPLVPSR